MPEFNEKEFKIHLKSDEFFPAYFITGNESYLKKNYCNQLINCILGDNFSGFNLDKFDGKNFILSQILDACEFMPMMNDKRCVVVEDIKADNFSDDDFANLKSYFLNPPDFTVLIFYNNSDTVPAKGKRVSDLFRNYGAVCNFNKRTGKELIKPLILSANKQGCMLSDKNAEYLVSVCGDDYNLLINEVNKLCHFVGNGDITLKAIDEIATKTDDAKIYLLTKSLLNKNFDMAYETLSSLLRQKTEPEYILGTIISTYVDIYRAKVSLNCSQNADSLADDFGYKKPAYRLINGARDSRGMELDVIRKCLNELSDADKQLKFSRESATVIFEKLMVKLFLIANGEKV